MSGRCKVKDCNGPVFCKGFCRKCYMRFRNGVIDERGKFLHKLYHSNYTVCKIKGCSNKIGNDGSKRHGLCGKCKAQVRLGIMDKEGNKLREKYVRVL